MRKVRILLAFFITLPTIEFPVYKLPPNMKLTLLMADFPSLNLVSITFSWTYFSSLIMSMFSLSLPLKMLATTIKEKY